MAIQASAVLTVFRQLPDGTTVPHLAPDWLALSAAPSGAGHQKGTRTLVGSPRQKTLVRHPRHRTLVRLPAHCCRPGTLLQLVPDMCPAPPHSRHVRRQSKDIFGGLTSSPDIGYCDLGTPAEPGEAHQPRGTAPTSKSATLEGTSTRGTVSSQRNAPEVYYHPRTICPSVRVPPGVYTAYLETPC